MMPAWTTGAVLVGTNDGIIWMSAPGHDNDNENDVVVTLPWGNASEAVYGFAASEADDGTVRAYALTAPRDAVTSGMMVEMAMASSVAVYVATFPDGSVHSPGPKWVPATRLPALAGVGGALGATFVRMAPGDVDSVYLAGMCMKDCGFAPNNTTGCVSLCSLFKG
jgi:hypothetical protein